MSENKIDIIKWGPRLSSVKCANIDLGPILEREDGTRVQPRWESWVDCAAIDLDFSVVAC